MSEQTARPSIGYPAVPLDEILARAARQWPDRVAISAAAGDMTFAELDRTASRAAAAALELAGGAGRRIAISTDLSADFAVAFYGIIRSGNVAVTLNPLRGAQAAATTITASGASAAVVGASLLGQLAPMADSLPALVALSRDGSPGTRSLAELAAEAPQAPLPAGQPGNLACLHYTSGTTGNPKGVLLTHHNLVVNAAQTVQAHGLGPDAVSFNALPIYHLMHLNAAIYAGATQVLYGAPALRGQGRVADSLPEATRAGATHYYTLPMLLTLLARDPELPQLWASGLRGMFCGGSALPAPVARALSQQFGIPVLQGYGLAEASSMTHLDRTDRPRPGSAGVPAADTECRVVHVDTRAPLACGEPGEIEVRGPQIMAGYADGSPSLTADGWLPTGDVGRIDEEGHLFLTDRLKDVFKCGNELISPSELEQVIASHPAVRDCAVVDQSDPVRGAVPVALLVLDSPAVDTAEVIGYANDRLAAFQQIRAVRIVDVVPRTPIGKVARRQLRETVAAGLSS